MLLANDEHGLTPIQRLCALYSQWTQHHNDDQNSPAFREHLARQLRLATKVCDTTAAAAATLLDTPATKEAGGSTAIHLALTPHALDNNTVPLLHALLPYVKGDQCASVQDARGRTPLMLAIEMKNGDAALALMKLATGKAVDKQCVTVTKEKGALLHMHSKYIACCCSRRRPQACHFKRDCVDVCNRV